MPVQVAGADRRPLIVDEHQLVVHVDRTALPIRAEARDSRESEVVVYEERCAHGECRSAIRLRGHERHDFYASLQRATETINNRGDVDVLILDIDRPARGVDGGAVLIEVGSIALD